MAKELPYYQFEPAEYLTKDISFCSLSAQGLFTNVCAYYWQRQCKLTKTQFLKRLNYPELFDELVSEGVIDLENDNIKIKFLYEQYCKVTNVSKVNSANGSKGGRPKKENQIKSEIKANENPIESQSKGIREDKIKEEEIKKENNNTLSSSSNIDFAGLLDFINKTFNKQFRSINETTKAKYNKLLKTIPKEDIIRAIESCKKSDFHKENKYRFCTPSFFARFETIEKWGTQSTIQQENKPYNPRS